ncbi:MAG: hypothetical protein ACO1OB_31315 [Archangium sp.]
MSGATIEEFLYRVSLEPADHWGMSTSIGLETERPYLNIGNVYAFVNGYSAARGESFSPFFLWLRDTAGAYPGGGWARHHLELAGGDHTRATQLFFARIHEWALETRPAWFTEFNRVPRGSLWMRGNGEHVTADVRLPAHVLAVTGKPSVDLSHIHVSSTEMTDGFNLHLGLPDDVATAWASGARRVVMLGDRRLKPTREVRVAMSELVLPADAICVDVSNEQADVLSTGGAGVVHIREGHLLDVVHGTRRIELRPRDRLLLLSPALFEFAKSLPLGELRSQLATADTLAWAQAIDTPRRRLCLCIEFREREHVGAQPQ